MNKIKSWFLMILFTVILCPLTIAHNLEPILPGSSSKLDEIASHADVIVVAKLVSLGITMPNALGQADYDSAQLHVTQTLKGSLDQRMLVSITVHYLRGTIEETTPKEGEEYLFFIRTNKTKRPKILKIVSATSENITKVKALIAASVTE